MKEKLINEAKRVMKNAYAPYSNFHVGASCLLSDGNIVSGCNVENASYGLAVCAERNCLFQTVALGYKKDDIVAMAVVSDFTGKTVPCGACRQVIIELCNPNMPIYLVSKDSEEELRAIDLLPFAFTSEDMK